MLGGVFEGSAVTCTGLAATVGIEVGRSVDVGVGLVSDATLRDLHWLSALPLTPNFCIGPQPSVVVVMMMPPATRRVMTLTITAAATGRRNKMRQLIQSRAFSWRLIAVRRA